MSLWKVPRYLLSKGNLLTRTTLALQKSYSDVYEPDYLASMEPDIPIYECLNIQLKGYDYPVLESYQKLVHKLAETLDVDVEECWATPCQKLKIQRFKPASSVVETDYHVSVYERNVQICDVPSTSYSILVRLLQESIPEGVSMQVHEALEEHQQIRYVPDIQLKALKKQLTVLGGPAKKPKK